MGYNHVFFFVNTYENELDDWYSSNNGITNLSCNLTWTLMIPLRYWSFKSFLIFSERISEYIHLIVFQFVIPRFFNDYILEIFKMKMLQIRESSIRCSSLWRSFSSMDSLNSCVLLTFPLFPFASSRPAAKLMTRNFGSWFAEFELSGLFRLVYFYNYQTKMSSVVILLQLLFMWVQILSLAPSHLFCSIQVQRLARCLVVLTLALDMSSSRLASSSTSQLASPDVRCCLTVSTLLLVSTYSQCCSSNILYNCNIQILTAVSLWSPFLRAQALRRASLHLCSFRVHLFAFVMYSFVWILQTLHLVPLLLVGGLRVYSSSAALLSPFLSLNTIRVQLLDTEFPLLLVLGSGVRPSECIGFSSPIPCLDSPDNLLEPYTGHVLFSTWSRLHSICSHSSVPFSTLWTTTIMTHILLLFFPEIHFHLVLVTTLDSFFGTCCICISLCCADGNSS